MRLIPPYLHPDVKSWGEKRLFDELKGSSLTDDYHILHSVNLPDHLYKVCGELDFVIVSPRGLFVLEIKGGQVSRKDGIWVYEDRYGNQRRSSEGPFNQAESGMYSLRNRLLETVSEEDLKQIVLGWGVIFPSCSFEFSSVEWDEKIILDAPAWKNEGIVDYLIKLENYWHEKHRGKPTRCSTDIVRKIVQAIRPDFYPAVSLRVQADEIEGRLVRMSQEQYDRLEIIEHCPRILIEGGAGTGKTFLACETAKRHASDQKKVLFLCYSPVLAAFLNKRIGSDFITVTSIHNLMLKTVRKYGDLPAGFTQGMPVIDPWFMEKLAPAFEHAAINLPVDDKYQVLIVDEGQDIINFSYLMVLDKLLVGGLEEGVWRIYLDPYNQSAIFGAFDPEALELLKSLGPVPPRLKVNCRNTDPILMQTRAATGADIATISTGPGPVVSTRFYQSRDQAVLLLEEFLESLDADETPLSEITILSPLPFEESSASLLSRKWLRRIQILNTDVWDKFPFSNVSYSTVSGFKGLENRFIALIDIDEIDTSLNIATLYVGMTRARVQLWLCIDEQLKKHWQDVIIKNLKKISEESRLGQQR